MILKLVVLFLILFVALALLTGPGFRRTLLRMLGFRTNGRR